MSMSIEDILALLAVSGNTKSGNKTDLSTLLSPELGIFSGTFMNQPDPRTSEEFIRQRNMPLTNEILSRSQPNSLRAQILAMVESGSTEAEIGNWIDSMDTDGYYTNNPTDVYETKQDLKALTKALKGENFKLQGELLDAQIASQSADPFRKAGLPTEYSVPEETSLVAQAIGEQGVASAQRRLAEIERERLRQEEKTVATKSVDKAYRDAGISELQQRDAMLRQELARSLQPGTPNTRSVTDIEKDLREVAKQMRSGQPAGPSLATRAGRGLLRGALGAVFGPALGALGGLAVGSGEPSQAPAGQGRRKAATPPSGYMAGATASQLPEELTPKKVSAADREALQLSAYLRPENQAKRQQEVQNLLARRIQSEQAAQGTGNPTVDALIRRAYVNRLMNG
jgi:hypothetical protein